MNLDIKTNTAEKTPVISSQRGRIHWPQIYSLAALNAAVIISWIAYHEYQPKLLQSFGLTEFSYFLFLSKALVLIFVPCAAGFIGDYLIRKSSNYFIVLTTGISVTAMTFMLVATIVKTGPDSILADLLPVMVVLWLIAMNIFHTPANSLVELFAPVNQLPVVMGVIVMVTEILFALEPVVVYLVEFLGATATFAFGGILIAAAGLTFRKYASESANEKETEENFQEKRTSNLLLVFIIGLIAGFCHAMINGFLPWKFQTFRYELFSMWKPAYFASLMFMVAAIATLPVSRLAGDKSPSKILIAAVLLFALAITGAFATSEIYIFVMCSILCAVAFTMVSVTAFPFALRNLNASQVTFGTGIFFGSSEISDAIFDLVTL
jgi:hypothetical protein